MGRLLSLILLIATALSFNPNSFVLPNDAKVLVVVEGLDNSKCVVHAYEKVDGSFKEVFVTDGTMGRNGMNNYRKEGDGTTPIGVWQLNTPFGQKDPEVGFPSNYIKVDESYVWTDTTNKLVKDDSKTLTGERVGTKGYAGYYDYVIDAGYNKNAVKGKGNALFIHCSVPGSTSSSGCVQIPTERMVELMKLYGKYGDGKCYIAQAPRRSITKLYNAYGVCNGLSPNGEF